MREDKCGFEEYLPPKEKREVRLTQAEFDERGRPLTRVEQGTVISATIVGGNASIPPPPAGLAGAHLRGNSGGPYHSPFF